MERSFSEALKQRRTYYSITNQSPIPDQEIECIVNMTVRHVPSAFNSQSTRVVLLLGESHKKLWQIVKDALKKIVPAEAFVKTEEKIDNSFACGYGTVLFFEDQKVVKGLQEAFPSYQDNFPRFHARRTSSSLQHYNPLIDDEVRRAWNLPGHWHLIAEMPFGLPVTKPGEKEFQPLEERVRVFK